VLFRSLATWGLELSSPFQKPSVNNAAFAEYTRGTGLKRVSDVDAAISLLEHAVSADPDSPSTHAALAEAEWVKYYATRQSSWRDRASESLRRAELRNPDVAAVRSVSGILEAAVGRHEQAQADYRRAIQLDPGNSDHYRRLGMSLQEVNDMPQALAAYKQAIAMNPREYRNYTQLGLLFDAQSDYEHATEEYSRALELVPRESLTLRLLGQAYMNAGRLDEAEVQLRKALTVAETPMTAQALGTTLLYKGQDAEAIIFFKRALTLDPKRFLSWLTLSTAWAMAGKTRLSRDAARQGLALAEGELRRNPRSGYIRSALGYMAARTDDRARAESEIEQALQLSPLDANARFFAATTYEVLGLRDRTLAVLTSAPPQVLADLNRYPEVTSLRTDPRFLQLLKPSQSKGQTTDAH